MSRYRFELASPADDEALRGVLNQTPMDGDVSISFRREPSFFDAAVVGGDFVQTVVGRDTSTGELVGFGMRSVRTMYVNGQPRPIGYLSSLRVLPEHRNLGLIARGYRYFAQLHRDGRTGLYLTTIAEGNDRAVSILTSGRAGLPPYHFAGRYFTLAFPSFKSCKPREWPGLTIRLAEEGDVPAVVEWLNNEGRRRQFFPQYTVADLLEPDGTFRDLRPRDVMLAIQGGNIVGTLAVWNQARFRQTVVHRYSRRIRWTRPFYNVWAGFRGSPRLPPVGRPIQFATAAVPVIAYDDRSVFQALLSAARVRAAWNGAKHLLLGLHETDPLLPVCRKRAVATYVTRLYHVCWPDGEKLRLSLDDRPPYLELGTL